jgi:transcriptional regulator with XRE-family HTH domain
MMDPAEQARESAAAALGNPLSLGRTIRRLRKRRQLTLEELAARVGLQHSELTRIEKGESRASLETMLRIFKELQAEIAELVNGIEERS